MDWRKLKEVITKETKLVISVGLWGNPYGLLEIDNICNKKGITHLVDGAQLFDAKVENSGISHVADLVVLSFDSTKSFSVGEGGVILGRGNLELRDRLLLVTEHPFRIHSEIKDESLIEVMMDGCNLNMRINPLGALVGLNRIEKNSIKNTFRGYEKNQSILNSVLSVFKVSVLEKPNSQFNTESNHKTFLVDASHLSKIERSTMRDKLFSAGFESTPCPYITFDEMIRKHQGCLFPWQGSPHFIYHESHKKENMVWANYWARGLEIIRVNNLN
jgi:dTDP-4-amino-4,6-dideoxygalactose transaminase